MPPSDPRTDLALIAAANEGDERAFVALYERYRDWVIRLAERFTGHSDDALDVLQETFGYLMRKFPGFELRAAMTTFLFPVVKNLSLASMRKRRRAPVGDEDFIAAAPSRELPADNSRRELALVIQSLPATHSEVVLLRFVDGLSLEEIAGALAIPLGTVKSRLHNALSTLRNDERTRQYFDIDPNS